MQKIKQAVIDQSRKKLLKSYLSDINKTIVEGRLVFYRAKYNILVIAVSGVFTIDPFEIRALISETINFFNEKCNSMMIDVKLPNKRPDQYQIREFAKI